MKRIGIVAHSAEGGALCFITACREGQRILGPHFHPEIVVSAIPMGQSMPGWESGDYSLVAAQLRLGIERVAQAGADFFICPDNTAHIALEPIADTFPIPGLHIAHVVCHEMQSSGWNRAGLLGTEWTMTGPVYPRALKERDLDMLAPPAERRQQLHHAIFHELTRGLFLPSTTATFVEAIRELQKGGADCVILGCTEIPLIIDGDNSPLPILDSTRLLANYAVREALAPEANGGTGGWIRVRDAAETTASMTR